MQRTIGNQAVQRMLHTSQIPVQATEINRPGDRYEQEADRVAERVMGGTDAPLTRRGMEQVRLPGGSQGGGKPLPDEVRTFMEPRFGFDFSQVRVHTDLDAVQMSRKLNAQAFTHHEHIYYGAGKSPGTNALTAHELTHVVQQAAAGGLQGDAAPVPAIQRELEVRPPGRGEGSAFPRRQELIDRLNAQSAAIQYRLDDRRIRYEIVDEATLTAFDRQMQRFIDRVELVPMRLTTGANLVLQPDGTFAPMMGDDLEEGYVDLDDLMASDDYSFRSIMVHFLTERFAVPNYAHRIGMPISNAEFRQAHLRGKAAEAALLQELFNDPSIQFNYDETLPNQTWLNNFTSLDHHYQVFQVVVASDREITGATMFVRTQDGRRVTMDDFRAERAAAAGR